MKKLKEIKSIPNFNFHGPIFQLVDKKIVD